MIDKVVGPVGAQWVRGALQVNPFEYDGNPAPSDHFPTEDAYNSALLDACEEHGIELLAVTDHWKASSGAGLIAAGESRGIVVLPGFEANCKEGFHLLVIFEEGTELSSITAAIGACGAPENDPHGPGTRSFSEIAADMTQRGALVIPAHVNIATSGLLSRESGKPLQNIIKNECILALGVVPSQVPMGDQEDILANKTPYERLHPLVPVYADDVSHPDTLASEGATSWYKMSTPSLRGLKHALRTPEIRVRRSGPDPQRGTRIKEVSWTGGFLDGLTIPVGPELTTLIGGRGTGKSTVIESIRFALEQPPLGERALRDHESVVAKVLGPGAIVRVEVERYEPNPATYIIQRITNEPAAVFDASDTKTQQKPADIIGDFEAFGQHELAELAQDKALLAELIRRLGGDSESEIQRPSLVARLADNRSELASVEGKIDELEEKLAEKPRLIEQAEKFAETDLGTKLNEKRSIEEERSVFQEVARRIDASSERVRSFDITSAVAEINASLPKPAESARRIHVDAARSSMQTLSDVMQSSIEAIDAAITAARQSLSQSKKEWDEASIADQESHAATVRDLVDQGYDPDAYLKTTSSLQSLELRAEECSALKRRHHRLINEREDLLRELAALDMEAVQNLHQAITATNALTNKTVNVRPTPDPDRAAIKNVITKFFKTPRTQIMAAIDKDSFSVASFVRAARAKPHELGKYGITGAQATNFIAHGEVMLRELEEHTVGIAVDVYLNVSPDGVEYRKLDDLSKGQRATALLLLLLSVSTTPLVIDQPEDDLDNRFVYHGIVKNLRSLKGTRQVLVSTHNANVPVLGDAELIVVLEGDGHRGSIPTGGIGSLDEQVIRFHSEKLLEGGEEAFRARRHLYGF